jgi:hypothetical protein
MYSQTIIQDIFNQPANFQKQQLTFNEQTFSNMQQTIHIRKNN